MRRRMSMHGKVWVTVSSDKWQVAAAILCRVGQLLCFHVCLLCSVSWGLVYKDIASYQRDVYRITQPLGAFFFISHTVLSLVESKGKWKWRKAQLVSHGMRGSFWLVQTIFFIDYSWREEKASRGCVILYTFRRKVVDNLLCLCLNKNDIFKLWNYFF